MKKLFLIRLSFLVLALSPLITSATDAPVTTIATIPNAVPGAISVPVTVINFSNIGAISLTIDYDYSGLHFVSGTPNPLLPGTAINDNNLGNGKHRIIMGWYSTVGVSLTSGSTIMTLNFTYISGNDSLNFFDNGPSCEYATPGGIVLNDIPASTYYINGFICGGVASPGTITGSASVCQGQTGVSYSVNVIPNSLGYNWTVPSGATIMTGTNTNAITVDYSLAAVSGNISVNGFNQCGNGPVSSLPVTVNVLPVANAYNDTTIPFGTSTILHAANGGAGTYSYHWEPANLLVNPNVQNPQTVILTSTTVFTLTVTNQVSLCQNTDQKVVNISGGPLSINPIAIPSAICLGESSQLYANPGGGSGNFSYSWTCTPPGTPPWSSNLPNPLVTPDVTTVYHLTVDDGFTSVSGNTTVTVYTLPTATISGGDTLCGTGLSTTLTIALTGAPPWDFIYSNGLLTFPVTNQLTTPYIFNVTLPGTYAVLWVHDVNCSGNTFGTAIVAVFPIPPTPVISTAGFQLISTACCGNQWYKDLVPVPGANAETFTPGQTGHYTDIVTLNSCSSDTSNDIYFVMEGIAGLKTEIFKIEPNPATDHFRLTSATGMKNVSVSFYSPAGSLMKEVQLESAQEQHIFFFDASLLSPGFYLLQIRSGNSCTYKKLIIY